MKRRQFITLLGGAAAAWPLAARAQQRERVRRIGVLLPATPDDARYQLWLGAFLQGLGQFGWNLGQNVRIDALWATSNSEAVRRHAAELAAAAPDVILAAGASTLGPLLHATRTVPIVFAIVADPVGAGFVETLAKPGGNATGFMSFEYGTAGKWLELLKQIAPVLTRVAVLRDAATASGIAQFGVIQAMAPSLRTSFASSGPGGLITATSGLAIVHRNLIVTLAAQRRLPAIYFERIFAVEGGLVSYGPDNADQFRRTAEYVDRILKGERPAELPVQAPVKYELVINVKTAKALGLEVPPTLLARADEVIE